MTIQDDWRKTFRELQQHVHKIAIDHGFWRNPRSDGESIALMHSELSEALEWIRKPEGASLASDHIPEFLGIEEELADVIIRVLDYAEFEGLDVGGALVAKIKFNDERPYRHGGKKL